MANDHDAYASTSAQVKGVRDVAKECDCAVLLLCQLNRQGAARSKDDQRPQTTDLRDSGKIEEVARNIWLLYRNDPDNNGSTTMELNVAKATHGQTGLVNVRCNFSQMKIW
jgi:replicative DNA helicase